jgi:histidinol-phosphatase
MFEGAKLFPKEDSVPVRDDLDFALALANTADAAALSLFGSRDLAPSYKADGSVVCEADRAVEQELRGMIARNRPTDGVLGEELGETVSGASMRWIIDPIDGTESYLRSIPVFATLIALEVSGEIVVGVASAPALRRRWWAAQSLGAFCNGRKIQVSDVANIGDAIIGYTSFHAFARFGLEQPFLRLLRAARDSRGYGDFLSHMLVAEGTLDVAVDPVAARWDWATLKIIVEEACGKFSDLRGRPPHVLSGILSTNRHLHQPALAELREVGAPDG